MPWQRRRGTVVAGMLSVGFILALEVFLVPGSPGGYVDRAFGGVVMSMIGVAVFRGAVWPAIRLGHESVELRNPLVDRLVAGAGVDVALVNGSLVVRAGTRTYAVFAFGGSVIGQMRGNRSSVRVAELFAQTYAGAGPVVMRRSFRPLAFHVSLAAIIGLCVGLIPAI